MAKPTSVKTSRRKPPTNSADKSASPAPNCGKEGAYSGSVLSSDLTLDEMQKIEAELAPLTSAVQDASQRIFPQRNAGGTPHFRRKFLRERADRMLSRSLAERSYFSLPEVILELARLPGTIRLDEHAKESAERLLLDSYRGHEFDRGERSTVRLRSSEFSMGLFSPEDLAAAGEVVPPNDFRSIYLDQLYFRRSILAAWFEAHGLAWPLSWGPEPVAKQPAHMTSSFEIQAQNEGKEGFELKQRRRHRISQEKAAEMRAMYARVHAIRDHRWPVKEMRPSGAIMAEHVRDAARKSDRHSGRDVNLRVGNRALAQICDETYPAIEFRAFLEQRSARGQKPKTA